MTNEQRVNNVYGRRRFRDGMAPGEAMQERREVRLQKAGIRTKFGGSNPKRATERRLVTVAMMRLAEFAGLCGSCAVSQNGVCVFHKD